MGFIAPLVAAIPAMFTTATSAAASFASTALASAQGVAASLGPVSGGASTAESLFGQSIANTKLATGLDMAGSLFSGIGDAQAHNYRASVLRLNQNMSLQAGQTEESASRLQTGELIAGQKAAQAANGIDVNSGSALAVRNTSQIIGDMDAALIHYNAASKAYGFGTEAGLETKAAGNSILKGAFGAASSFIRGGTSLADKWLGYQMNFGQGGGSNDISITDMLKGLSPIENPGIG